MTTSSLCMQNADLVEIFWPENIAQTWQTLQSILCGEQGWHLSAQGHSKTKGRRRGRKGIDSPCQQLYKKELVIKQCNLHGSNTVSMECNWLYWERLALVICGLLHLRQPVVGSPRPECTSPGCEIGFWLVLLSEFWLPLCSVFEALLSPGPLRNHNA